MTTLYRVTIDEYAGEDGVRYVLLDAVAARAVTDLLSDWRAPITDYLSTVKLSDPAAVVGELRELRERDAERVWTSAHTDY